MAPSIIRLQIKFYLLCSLACLCLLFYFASMESLNVNPVWKFLTLNYFLNTLRCRFNLWSDFCHLNKGILFRICKSKRWTKENVDFNKENMCPHWQDGHLKLNTNQHFFVSKAQIPTCKATFPFLIVKTHCFWPKTLSKKRYPNPKRRPR